MAHRYYVYILTDDRHTVPYTGVTNDLLRRVGERRAKTFPGFTRRYNVQKLVHFFEEFAGVNDAIAREKQIKAGSRRRKIALINGMNPEWRDLSPALI